MYPKITYSLLVEKKACKPHLDLFVKHFGKTKAIPLTKKVVTQFGSVFDISWTAENLLTLEDYKEYKKVTAPAWEEYKKVTAPAWEEYNKVEAQDLEEYNKVTAPAWEEYNKVTAPAFVEIYKKGMKKKA